GDRRKVPHEAGARTLRLPDDRPWRHPPEEGAIMGRTGFAAIVAADIAALTVNVGVAAAGGGLLVGPDNHVDPPLSQSAALTLHSAAGDIQAVVYDGNEGATVSTTLSGFTVPAGAITAKTTYVVADGQCGS